MPSWLNNAIFYEIYPQSFCDSNGDGIGDINGMISKLDYIVDSGFNAIWLNPWFKSENFRDAGYDITDFYRVDPRYGSNEDAARFCAECHKRGVKVLLDLVIGHTAIEHPWFAESCKLEKNEYTDLFIWSPQVNWRGAPDEPGDYYVSGWSPRGAFKANFFAVQPAFNFGYNEIRYRWEMPCDAEIPRRNREVFKDIMRFWLDLGCDGFRVDMAHSVVKRDPEYRKSIEFWQDMRAMFDREYPEANVRCMLILDATTGQNGIQQAKQFKEAADIGGIVITKLDGTAKGGVAIAIRKELNVPVWYIGVGEGIDDLQAFDAKEFVEALF